MVERSLMAAVAAAVLFAGAGHAQGTAVDPTDVDSAVVRALSPSDAVDVFILEPAMEVGRNRFVAVAVRLPNDGTTAPTLHGCGTSGAARPLRAVCVVLATPGATNSESPFNVDSLEIDDLDGDDVGEVRLSVSYQGAWERPGVGSDFSRMYVVSAAPTLRVALTIETVRYRMLNDNSTVRRVEMRDVNNDGVPDAIVFESICDGQPGEASDDDPSCRHAVQRYLYNRATRLWRSGPIARQPARRP